ncbi:DNA primase [Holzapfeliella sp. JNUCC 80]
MAQFIPETFIDEVRTNTDILDVASQYIQFQKKGKNYFGLCPFHEERTPSFSISEEKQIFHCFSCGRGGNVFKLLMDIENLSFPEAVLKVAQDNNIPIPSDVQSTTTNKQEQLRSHPLRQAYREVSELYHHILMVTDYGKEALNYLMNRGMTEATIKEFQLGFAPPRDIVYDFLLNKGHQPEDLANSGLFINSNSDEKLRDRFKNRIMYPISDNYGNVIAFSGRTLRDDSDEPKYLNSPETDIFNKSKTLFNYQKAKKNLRQRQSMVLFEGFMDVISAYEAGVKTGIASMGTSLTDQQIYLIKQATSDLVICYDGDNPGIKATNRAIKLLDKKQQFNLSVVLLPDGHDPDDFIRSYGSEAFVNQVNGAMTTIDFGLQLLQRHYNLDNNREKIEFVNSAVSLIARSHTEITQDLYSQKLAELTQLPIETIKNAVLSESQKQRRQVSRKPYQEQQPEPKKQDFSKKLSALEIAEVRLIYLVLRYEEVNDFVIQHQYEFNNSELGAIFKEWQTYKQSTGNPTISGFIDFISDDLKRIIVAIEMMQMPDYYSSKELEDYLSRSIKEKQAQQLQKLRAQLNEAKRQHDEQQELALTQQIIELRRLLN